MSEIDNNVLDGMRNDKIKDLGYLCYNMFIDGTNISPEFRNLVLDMHNYILYIKALRREHQFDINLSLYEGKLNEKAMELGCLYFNMYIDNKVYSDRAAELCNSISSLNQMICSKPTQAANGMKPSPYDAYEVQESNNKYSSIWDKEKKNKVTSQRKLKISSPYGMEPIPTNFKKCSCGYRNYSFARYCGKCGAKL